MIGGCGGHQLVLVVYEVLITCYGEFLEVKGGHVAIINCGVSIGFGIPHIVLVRCRSNLVVTGGATRPYTVLEVTRN